MSSAVRIAESAPMNERFAERSLIVMLCTSFSSKMRSISALSATPRLGWSMREMIQPI